MAAPIVGTVNDSDIPTSVLYPDSDDIISLPSTSPGSPMMAPTTSSVDSPHTNHSKLATDLLSILLQRTDDVSRREAIVAEREKALESNNTAQSKREADLDKREQQLGFKKMTATDKFRTALEELQISDVQAAVAMYTEWSSETLVLLLKIAREDPNNIYDRKEWELRRPSESTATSELTAATKRHPAVEPKENNVTTKSDAAKAGATTEQKKKSRKATVEDGD